ncbi:MAG: glycosyltransferase 87 family protein [Gillisia sp.]
MIKKFFQFHKVSLLLVSILIAFYISFAYDLVRTDFIKLFGLYTALFYLTWNVLKIEKKDLRYLIGLAIIFRLLFLVAIPNLSQDFYRFIWDGRMIVAGWNPYLYLPKDLIASSAAPMAQATELFHGMGRLNASHFTNYPPVNQLIFAIAALLSKNTLGSVIVMRMLIILADLGTLYFGRKLLKELNLPQHQVFWFILNPFVIIEFTGNLHFEGVMLFFLIWSIYLLKKKKWISSAVVMALSISLKLLPLLFLPLFFNYFRKEEGLGLAKLTGYYIVTGVVVVLAFLPFLSAELISNFWASTELWFQKFEFNASIYYIIRWIGFQVKGYNIIGTAGKVLPVITILIILALSFFRKNSSLKSLIPTMLFSVSVYLFLSTTVHPWYIATPLLLSVFTRYRFVMLWSFLIILSYYAYGNAFYKENLWLVAVEYTAVIGMFLYEGFFQKSRRSLFLS